MSRSVIYGDSRGNDMHSAPATDLFIFQLENGTRIEVCITPAGDALQIEKTRSGSLELVLDGHREMRIW